MSQRGKQKSVSSTETRAGGRVLNGRENSPAVFPGKAYTPSVYVSGNVLVQQSLMEIFDDLTPFISGQLKSMTQDEADAFDPPS